LTLNYLALLLLISYTTLWGPKLITRGAEADNQNRERGRPALDRRLVDPLLAVQEGNVF
jgi:hypothetical protein